MDGTFGVDSDSNMHVIESLVPVVMALTLEMAHKQRHTIPHSPTPSGQPAN